MAGTKISLQAILQLKSLPLRQIMLPRTHYKNQELAAIRKTFPGIQIAMRQIGAVDKDTKELYAPLH